MAFLQHQIGVFEASLLLARSRTESGHLGMQLRMYVHISRIPSKARAWRQKGDGPYGLYDAPKTNNVYKTIKSSIEG